MSREDAEKRRPVNKEAEMTDDVGVLWPCLDDGKLEFF
jgi:hypothetical protein